MSLPLHVVPVQIVFCPYFLELEQPPPYNLNFSYLYTFTIDHHGPYIDCIFTGTDCISIVFSLVQTIYSSYLQVLEDFALCVLCESSLKRPIRHGITKERKAFKLVAQRALDAANRKLPIPILEILLLTCYLHVCSFGGLWLGLHTAKGEAVRYHNRYHRNDTVFYRYCYRYLELR